MRPTSIVRFDRLYLGSIVLGLIGNLVEWPVTIARLTADPATAILGSSVPILVGGMIATGALIALLLWYFTAKRASNVARWIVTAFTAFAVGSLFVGYGSGAVVLDAGGIIRIVSVALQTAATFFLFRPDAAAWFAPFQTVEDDA
ncbi:hypothetical protein DMC47_06925 [Nostoc sp. 3335mG]|nr:hypothetical protein DMC47_06925 [Nostoc sp. 3335mG]